MADQKLTPEITSILQRSTITGNKLVLPRQLDRKLYTEVNKALTNLGGKWNRSAKAHVFADNPLSKLQSILLTGVAIDEKKQYQSFYTPPDLADELALMADVCGYSVLEPSAGEGALADACMKFGATEVQCIEIRSEAAAKLREKNYPVICADFIQQQPTRLFQRIVMNPPFSKHQDLKHIAHALNWLSSDGILISVLSANTDRLQFQNLLDREPCTTRQLPRGRFHASGTDVPAIILTINRQG